MTTDYTTPWEELVAAGLDDCGLPLEGHPDLPPPKPLGWTSERDPSVLAHRQGGRHAASIQPTLARRRYGGRGLGIVIRAEHSR
jgi:hypothetical protein